MIDWSLSNPSSDPAWFGEVLRQCTRSLANASGWPLSHAWVRDSTGEHLVSSGIWHPELGAEFLPWRQALASASFKRGVGLAGNVWQARATLATTDACDGLHAVDPELAPRRAVAFPVICADEVVAVVGLFHRDPAADDRTVIALASYLGQLLSQFAEQAERATDCTRLTALVETSDDAIISLDAKGTILSWNAGAERLYGYTRSEALGESLALIVPDELRPSAPVLVGVLRDARRLEQHETVRRRKNGQLVDVALTASPLLDDAGIVTGASTIERDISRRKRVESERLRVGQRRIGQCGQERVFGEYWPRAAHSDECDPGDARTFARRRTVTHPRGLSRHGP